MHGVAIALLAEDKERLSVLQHRLDGTQMGRNVFSQQGFPTSATDPILRQIQDVRAEVVLVDIDPHDVQRAIRAIELINANTSDIAIFAVGEMNNPLTIVAAMRSGAREYLEQHTTSEAILEALTRFATSRSKARASAGRARLFGRLRAHLRYVVVDCSNRVDQAARLLCDLSSSAVLVAHADVVSVLSANRIRTYMEEGSGHNRVRLMLNRYKKIPGFTDEDIEKATNCKLLWKLPNNYQSVAPAIDKGSPVAFHESQELGRAFRSMTTALVQASGGESPLEIAQQQDPGAKKKAPGRLLISPLRAGQ